MSDDECWGPPLHGFDWFRDCADEYRAEDQARYDIYLRNKLGVAPPLPESYSRFVLPFAYAPEPLPENRPFTANGTAPPRQAWTIERKRADATSLRQRQYFTVETGEVLYLRARRATLKQLGADAKPGGLALSETLHLGGHHEKSPPAFKALASPAELILFEWPTRQLDDTSSAPKAKAGFGDDPLLVGMLWRQVHFPQRHGPDAEQSLRLKQLLWFNELYRYVREPFEGHHHGEFRHLLGTDEPSADNDPYFDRWFDLLRLPLQDENERWYRLFPTAWDKASKAWASDRDVDGPHAMCHPDSRAFVATFAQVAGGAKALLPASARRDAKEPSENTPYQTGKTKRSDPPTDESLQRLVRTHGWIALLNIDNPKCIGEASPFEQRWADERTYQRWADLGTLYGYTPHSAALISGPCVEPPLWHHFATTYFDQTLLLLYLRTVIFRISQRINAITAKQRDGGSDKAAADQFQALSRQITQFINLYQYPFLSLQQQGVEMYELQRKFMDINALYLEVREEVERTQAQLDMNRQMTLTEASHRLGVLATYGIPIAVAALFGVAWNDLNAKLLFQGVFGDFINGLCTCEGSRCIEWVTAVTGLLLAVVTYLTVSEWVKSKIGKP